MQKQVASPEALDRMQLFRFWGSGEFQVMVAGQLTTITCTAGSNISSQDAALRCAAKAERVQLLIDGAIERDTSYNKPVREEIVHEVDDANILTRNRYGAVVLNTTSLSIFDIDDYQRSFWEILGLKGKKDNKTGILEHLHKIYAAQPRLGKSWRIYETFKGIRLITAGHYYDPRSPEFAQFSRAINADSLYTLLCTKQNCYRARLTPKPGRIKMEQLRFTCPLPEDIEGKYAHWLNNYQQQIKNYAVCRLLATLGEARVDDPIVEFHDRLCGIDSGLPLA